MDGKFYRFDLIVLLGRKVPMIPSSSSVLVAVSPV